MSGAGLVYADLDLRAARACATCCARTPARSSIDDDEQYERVKKFTLAFLPRFAERIKKLRGPPPDLRPLPHRARAPARGVAARPAASSGGSLVIDQGEALTAIDINTGSFTNTGSGNLEDTVTANNLEACEEVARQLRLRNIGGIIVVDFVDMDKEGNRRKVWDAFQKALSRDRARTNVTKISELGLVEMTRKRTRESLVQLLTEPCPTCEGSGVVKSVTTVAYEILREVRRSGTLVDNEKIEIECAPRVAEVLSQQERDYLDHLEKRFQKLIIVVGQKGWKPDQFRVAGKMSTEIAAEAAARGAEARPRARPRRASAAAASVAAVASAAAAVAAVAAGAADGAAGAADAAAGPRGRRRVAGALLAVRGAWLWGERVHARWRRGGPPLARPLTTVSRMEGGAISTTGLPRTPGRAIYLAAGAPRGADARVDENERGGLAQIESAGRALAGALLDRHLERQEVRRQRAELLAEPRRDVRRERLDRDVVDRQQQHVAARHHVALAAQGELELGVVAHDPEVRVLRGDQHVLLPRRAQLGQARLDRRERDHRRQVARAPRRARRRPCSCARAGAPSCRRGTPSCARTRTCTARARS